MSDLISREKNHRREPGKQAVPLTSRNVMAPLLIDHFNVIYTVMCQF